MTVSTTWDVRTLDEYLTPRVSGMNEAVEEDILRRFPAIFETSKLLSSPCIVTNTDGHIIFCYLPKVLTSCRHVSGLLLKSEE